MFRLLSMLSVYFFSQMVFKDVMKKFVTPFFVSSSVGLIRYTMKMAVFVVAGVVLLTTGFIYSVSELVRIISMESSFYFTPPLISGLIFLGVGIVFVSISAFSKIMIPRALRANPRDEAFFLDNFVTTIQSILKDMESQGPAPSAQEPPPRPSRPPYTEPQRPPPETFTH